MNEDLMHFLISSSPLMYCILLVLLIFDYEDLQKHINLGLLAGLPFFMGFLHFILYRLLYFVPRKHGDTFYTRFIISGVVAASIITLIFIAIGVFDKYSKEKDILFIIWVASAIIHTILYISIGIWLRTQIVYGSTQAYQDAIRYASRGSSSSSSSSSSSGSSNSGAYRTPPSNIGSYSTGSSENISGTSDSRFSNTSNPRPTGRSTETAFPQV